MLLRETSPGVFYSESPTISVGASDLAFLLQEARKNAKHRARLCAHPDVSDPVHEMVICLLQDCHVQPHCHRKCESLHIIEGHCDLVLFDPGGRIMNVVELGNLAEKTRYIRLEPQLFHTLIVRSKYVVFHETVRGPFRREDTLHADWAPSEGETESLRRYFCELDESISKLRINGKGS